MTPWLTRPTACPRPSRGSAQEEGKGFSEEYVHLKNGLTRASKRVYKVKLGDSVTLVKL